MKTYQIASNWRFGHESATAFSAANDDDAINGFDRWVSAITRRFPRKLASANLYELTVGPIDQSGNVTGGIGKRLATTIDEPSIGVVGTFDTRIAEWDPTEPLDSATFVRA